MPYTVGLMREENMDKKNMYKITVGEEKKGENIWCEKKCERKKCYIRANN